MRILYCLFFGDCPSRRLRVDVELALTRSRASVSHGAYLGHRGDRSAGLMLLERHELIAGRDDRAGDCPWQWLPRRVAMR